MYKPKIDPGHYFHLADGKIIKNVEELSIVLDRVSKDVFHEHVNPYKNDFASWIYDVFRLSDLSKMLGNVKSKDETARILKAYLRKNKSETSNKIDAPIVTAQEVAQSSNVSTQNTIPVNETKEQETHKSQVQPKLKKYVWKSSESESIEQHKIDVLKKKKEEESKKGEKETKKEPQKEEKKEEQKEPQKEPKELPKVNKPDITSDADEFFEKNPVTIDQRIKVKQKQLNLKPLESIQARSMPDDKAAEKFKDFYTQVYQRMSELRKNGFDTDLAELMIQRIPTRIKVFETTQEDKDKIAVERYLNEVIEELNNLH